MTRRCEEVVPLLGPLLDGALPEDDREWVEDHLDGCVSCRDRKAFLRAQGDAIREVITSGAASANFDGFADRVLAKVSAQKPAPLPERARIWGSEMWAAHRGAFAATAGVALAACMALAVFFVPPAPQPDEAQLLADASSPQVEEVEFGTHDGAVLQLPGDTTVIWMSEDKAVQQ